MIPKALTGELAGLDRQPPAERGGLVQGGQLGLAGRSQRPVEGGQEYVGAHADPLLALARVAVDKTYFEPSLPN